MPAAQPLRRHAQLRDVPALRGQRVEGGSVADETATAAGRRAKTQTMSSSGSTTSAISSRREAAANREPGRACAASWAPSPSRVSGSARSVAQSAAAAAPAREHSSVVSPGCSSREEKYV